MQTKSIGLKTLLKGLLIPGQLLLAAVAVADLMDGVTLYRHLTSGNSTGEGYAAGYIAGIADVGSSVRRSSAVLGQKFCLPEGVTVGQLKDGVRVYLERHPAERQQAAVPLVARALAETFPCRK